MATLSLELPPRVYDYLHRAAERQQIALEAVVQAVLADYALPNIDLLDQYNDEELIAFLADRFNPLYQDRLDSLTAQARDWGLSSAEQNQLEYLLNLYGDYMVLRSKAFALLKERGHDISQYFTPLP